MHGRRGTERDRKSWDTPSCPACNTCGLARAPAGARTRTICWPARAIRLGPRLMSSPLRSPARSYAGSGRPRRRDWREQPSPGYQLSQRADTSTPKSACKPPSNARSSIRATNPLHRCIPPSARHRRRRQSHGGAAGTETRHHEHADVAARTCGRGRIRLNAFLDELELSDQSRPYTTVSRDLTLGAILRAGQRRRNQRMAYPAQTAPAVTRLPHWSKVPTPPANPPGRTNPPHPLWRCGSRSSSTGAPSAMPPTMTNVWP